VAGPQKSVLSRGLFKRFCILLTLASEYIFVLITFTVNNEIFWSNSEVHEVHTRHKHKLNRSTANLTVYQKEVY